MKKLFLSAAVMAFSVVSAPLAAAQSDSTANIDNSRDCDTVAIIKCGVFSRAELKQKYEQNEYGDLKPIFDKFEIDEGEMNGFVDGVVWRDGRVTVNGKTVATDAKTAGRWNSPKEGMQRIGGTQRAYIMDTRHMNSAQTAMVKMVDGQLEFAIIKPCGNPVAAKAVDKPKEQPKPDQPKPPKEDEPEVIVKQETHVQTETDVNQEVEDDEEEQTTTYVREEKIVEDESPEVIASTGPAGFAMGGAGISSLTTAGYYYLRSRRRLHGDS